MRRRVFFILIIAFLSLPQHVGAQAAPPTFAEYEQWVREAYVAAQRSDRIGLDDVAARLTGAREIALPGGEIAPADNRWLADALAEEPPNFRLIESRLGAILDAVVQSRAEHDPRALDKLNEVFSKPPFASREVPSAWTQFWRNVGNAISDFFEWLFRSTPNLGSVPAPTPTSFNGLSPVGWVLLLIGLLLVLGIVIYAIRGVRQSVVRDAKARAEAEAEAEQITATEALDRAQTQARNGDYRTAVRYLYLSSLLWLDERKLLRYDYSLTNREYLAEARSNPVLHEHLTPVIETFERVWYGHRELEEQDFRAYEQQVQALRKTESKS